MRRKTVMIFGLSSFVGSNLAEYLKKYFRVVGTYYSYRVEIEGITAFACDVLNRDQINGVIAIFKPDFIVYAAGVYSVEKASAYPKYADALNTIGLANVAEVAERYKSRICLVSSDLVFSGANILHYEGDTTDPNTVLGRTISSAEYFLKKSCLNFLIIRSCSLYGRGINPRQANWFEIFEKKIYRSENFSVDAKIKNGYLDIIYIAAILKLCLEKDISNRLVQVSSTDFMTRYEFVKTYTEIFGLNMDLISKGAWYYPFIETLASLQNAHLFSDEFLYKLDIQNTETLFHVSFPSIKESLKFTFERFHGKSSSKSISKGEEIKFI